MTKVGQQKSKAKQLSSLLSQQEAVKKSSSTNCLPNKTGPVVGLPKTGSAMSLYKTRSSTLLSKTGSPGKGKFVKGLPPKGRPLPHKQSLSKQKTGSLSCLSPAKTLMKTGSLTSVVSNGSLESLPSSCLSGKTGSEASLEPDMDGIDLIFAWQMLIF